jgi:uncharacterized protein DUF4157
MAENPLKKIIDKVQGKKAKTKPLKTEPQGTKATKLPKDVAQSMEESFGANVSKVKVHTGGNATDMCKEIGSKAFAKGNDIFVSKPGFAKDSKFLAHEMAHVIQQGGGKKMPKEQKGKVLVSK